MHETLKAHLSEEVTTLAWCWKLKPRQGKSLGFTNADIDLSIDGITFYANSGFTPSAISSSNKLNVDSLDVEGLIDSAHITEDDLLSGKFDHAELEIFMVNYLNPTHGKLNLRTGWLGELTVSQNQFIAEIRGLMQALSQTIGELYSSTCRARFADKRCKIEGKLFTFCGVINKVLSINKFTDDSLKQKNGYFDHGVITFTSGKNETKVFEVMSYFNHTLELFIAPYFELVEGDNYQIIAGCDKHLDTCKNKFNNVINFGGEPHVPTLDKLAVT